MEKHLTPVVFDRRAAPSTSVAEALSIPLGRPRRYDSPEALRRGIISYLESLQANDGSWIKPPTLSGAGVYLGFTSRCWHQRYSKQEAFKPLIDWLKFFVEAWREEQVVMPAKGVHAQGLMFLMNRLDAAERARSLTADQSGADRPADAKALIDQTWRNAEDDADEIKESAVTRATAEIEKLARMTPHERLIWHKAKQIEIEMALDRQVRIR